MWVLYYELDIMVIGKMLGASSVAIYAVAFTFMQFLRSLTGIIFTPYPDRFNHLVGTNELNGLKTLLEKVVLFTMPVITFIVISIVFLSKPIVLCWVGVNYIDSVYILMILGVNFAFSFITTPMSGILMSLLKIKEIYKINFLMAVVFWLDRKSVV